MKAVKHVENWVCGPTSTGGYQIAGSNAKLVSSGTPSVLAWRVQATVTVRTETEKQTGTGKCLHHQRWSVPISTGGRRADFLDRNETVLWYHLSSVSAHGIGGMGRLNGR